MKKTVIGQCAAVLFCLIFDGPVAAECEPVDHASSVCRYPTGDAWCARHGGGALYAYRDGCIEAKDPTETDTNLATRPPPPARSWTPVVGWDCAKANTRVEHLICANPEVRAQDARMSALYADLRARGRLPERTQKAWLIGQRNACDTADCLRAVYAERIRDLEALATANAAVPPVVDAQTIDLPGAPPDTSHPRSAPSAVEAPTMQAPAPIPEPTPITLSPTAPSPDGIPMLPQPETPTTASLRHPMGDASLGASEGTPPPRASIRALVLMGAMLLIIGFGLFAWRGGWRIGASARRALAVFAQQRWTASRVWFSGWRRPRWHTPAPAAHPAGAVDVVPAMAPGGVPLSDDTLARLCALAQPGESLPSVLARAVAALESVAEPPCDCG